MSPDDYGIVANFTVFLGILSIFIGLSTYGAVGVNFFKLEKKMLRTYISNVLMILIATTLITLFFLWFFSGLFIKFFIIPKILILIMPLMAFCQFLILINLVLWQSEQRPKPFCIFQISQNLIYAIFTIILVMIMKMRWQGQLISLLISTVMFASFSLLFIMRRGYLRFKFNPEYVKDVLFFGIPLVPHQLASWIRVGIDRILITSMIGLSATGLYSVGYQFGMIIGIIGAAFNRAWTPFLFNKLNSINQHGKVKLVKICYICFVAILMFSLALIFIVPQFMRFFLGVNFNGASRFVAWITLGYAFEAMYFLVANQIFYVKATHLLALATFISSIIHFLLSYSLIRLNGAIGSAQATSISFFISFLMVWFISNRVYPLPWFSFSEDRK
jgi:O-antigen/teichoic acid export membrane protein